MTLCMNKAETSIKIVLDLKSLNFTGIGNIRLSNIFKLKMLYNEQKKLVMKVDFVLR